MSENSKFLQDEFKRDLDEKKRYNDRVWLEMEIKQLDKDFHKYDRGHYWAYRNSLLKQLWSLE